jgi:uncharacterized protein YjcR
MIKLNRRKTPEFKAMLLKEYLSSPKISLMYLANIYGLNIGTLRSWSKKEGWYRKKMYK